MDSIEIIKKIFIKDFGIYLEKERTLVISDLHIGYEEELNKKGILVPRIQFNEYMRILEKTLKGIEVDTIVINGDLKHEFGTISETEWRYVLRLLDFLEKHCRKIILIRGNHDTILGPIARKRNVRVMDSFVAGDVFITHGNKILPSSKKTIIIGHEHPAVALKDGARLEKFKCFLVGKWKNKNLIVLPSMNPLIEGTDILREELLSPYLQESNLKYFRIYVVADKIYDFGKANTGIWLP
ncbi:metallophosphoesterase [Candidatus Woesearchaeota archaeon]|nr:metallophosphoesterase [Candidatus Woesearchaeota archaeon]